MPLAAGNRMGPYEILSPLGAGGMGEVYKARDTRLDRSVAVKVLPPHIANREDLRARFEREARAVASLNHPHICVLHDIGNQDGIAYMVMEHLEGETLEARIARGALPLDVALQYAMQAADALDRAHRAGITHRDIKPGNIMLTRDGVKVLDFGLAKSTAKPGPTDATLTIEGTLLGTPQYMAPEQFEGKEADARADVWAFGSVLYEMATGQKAFQGKSYSSLVGAILSADPAPMSVKPFTPAWLDRLVRRCLAKDPDDRYQSMRDVLLDLRTPPAEITSQKVGRSKWLWPAIAAAGLALGVAGWLQRPTLRDAEVVRFEIPPPENTMFRHVALSPDGRQLAFVTLGSSGQGLWLRPLDSRESRPIPGTENARYPFWSPDSRQIGYFAGAKILKVDASGGTPVTVGDLPGSARGDALGGAWSRDGVLLIGTSQGLFRVEANGGTPSPITSQKRAGLHTAPQFLTDGQRFLFAHQQAGGLTSVRLGSLGSDRDETLVEGSTGAVFVESGFIVFERQGSLMAQAFDSGRRQLRGEAIQMDDSLASTFASRAAESSRLFSASQAGSMAHIHGPTGANRKLIWADRSGRETMDASSAGEWRSTMLSPSGTRIAVTRFVRGQIGIWIIDPERHVESRLTLDSTTGLFPVWSPDEKRVAFFSARSPVSGIYAKAPDGSAKEELLLRNQETLRLRDWSADGRFLVYWQAGDLWLLPMDGDRKPFPFLQTHSDEDDGQFAPLSGGRARWIAYSSDETGRREVFVHGFSGEAGKASEGLGKTMISNGGGRYPRWRADGRELYYLSDDGQIMAVDVSNGDVFRAGASKALFRGQPLTAGAGFPYSITPRGDRFLLNYPVGNERPAPVIVTLNWTRLLEKRK